MKNYKQTISTFLRTQKHILLTGCLLLIAITLLFGIFGQLQPPAPAKAVPEGVRTVDYSTFVGQVKAGNVLAVIVQGDDLHSLLVHPFLVDTTSKVLPVTSPSSRQLTDIAAWTRYVNAGYPNQLQAGSNYAGRSPAPSIDIQRALYTHLPESGDAGLMPLLLSRHVVVNTLTAASTPVWLGILWRSMLILLLLLLCLQVFTSRASRRFSSSLDARISSRGQSHSQRFERVKEASKLQAQDKKTSSLHEVQTKLAPPVTFADVAGIDEVRVELEEVVQFLRNPEYVRHLGACVPRGVLLAGPPGTGKTLLAKAVAGEAGVAFLSMSASEFVEKFVGVGASRVRKLFEEARQSAPCIIFIDELDAVGRQRHLMGNDERDQTLNQLLVELDGFDSRKAIIVMAATNRVDMLDKALLRPGRFDRHVTVSLPDRAGREAILKVHTRRTPLYEDVSLERLARLTTGMSGADLANLVNEAALLAARQNLDTLTCQCFEDALARVQLGALRPLIMSAEDKHIIAVHEGGHALVAYHLPLADTVNRVTILPRGQSLGVTQFVAGEDRYNYSRESLMARIAVGLGGRAAEELILGPQHVTTGAENDLQMVTNLARRMVTHWGMSEQLGVVFAGDDLARMSLNMRRVDASRQPLRARSLVLVADGRFLLNGEERTAHLYSPGASMPATYKGSTSMAALIDAEVQRILKEGYAMAQTVLREHSEQLTRLADALMESEQLDRVQFEALLCEEGIAHS